jgi:hypothetical protein
MKLREIAFSRCGDKGNASNVCVFVYEDRHWDWLRTWLTADRVAEHYGPLVLGAVKRYEFPKLHGLNFVLEDALGGGGSMSTRPDGLAKSYQSWILDLDVPDAEVGPPAAQG